ncbi:Fe-S cluster assembly protein SufB [Candidatus Gracilibacteria bacterium]|nr:Fe-S cluster assembly protein SufB [Candidatus Gracilibacteria bacterium]
MSNNDQIHTLGEVSRALFDGHDDAVYSNEFEYGVSESVVRKIWEQNKEPEWMLEKRLASLKVFQEKAMPTWGPDLSKLDLAKICYYARPEGASNAKSWDDVPDKIKNTFERLGIPEAERTMLAGVGAQYDSEVVYHNLRQELRDQGVIFEDMSVAVNEHAELVQKYFMKLIPASDHIFAALHGAVWSGGTFLYVPRGVEISDPLQAYFRMNVKSGGQFEHTLMIIEDEATAHYIEGCSAPKYDTPSLHAGMVEIFVGKKAKMRYTSVENWSIDTYNLNTKRSVVQEEGYMEWVGGNFGSGVTMLYPCTILQGRKSSCDHLGVAFANAGQNVDGGAKVIHIGEDTSSNVIMKSLSKGGGLSTYRGLLDIQPGAHNAVSRIDCDALILDSLSKNDTIPDIRVRNASSICAHEASAGRISPEQLYYLQSRGIGEAEAKAMIINGFISPIVKELPLEYAAELNALIALEMEGSVG